MRQNPMGKVTAPVFLLENGRNVKEMLFQYYLQQKSK